jgi:hypothetical protein
LNFAALRAAFCDCWSPLRSFSAPTFLPFVGQPDLRLKTLLHTLHDDNDIETKMVMTSILKVFIAFSFTGKTFIYFNNCMVLPAGILFC